ncbi:hypothetical protein PV331_45030 [Streptomyces sp. WI04-05B]|uniref:hypothetical protein n=1 Tax=Streptomyces TaxID=1883 RepID=UPI0029A4126D|nr:MULTISPECIES: hypothetical protein [unclassified Streptomyces]MDX2548947.1 hypothetical protein [Streptomyces sp. WI04-05B]MDX2590560.1 hypothetical protein [Streptomyces sp. WI04-05A]MDX3750703.1 hypothetical protein [Streptomyces sp. AK08-02]
MVRRVLGGGEAQPRWLPRRLLTVVSADVDDEAGVGVVWMVWRPGASRESVSREHLEFVEWHEGRWRSLGGVGSFVGDPVEVEADGIEVRGGAGSLSLTRRLDPPRSVEAALWIACVRVYTGRDIDHVLVGDRRFDVSEGRRVVAVWKGPQIRRGYRPDIVALDRDGVELSRIGPLDSLDSRTWARVREELGEAGEVGELGEPEGG